MAGKRKKESGLTLDERLKRAMVPEEEQPYPVLGNWIWAKGKDIFDAMETKRPDGKIFRYIDIDSIDNKAQSVRQPKEILTCHAPSRASRAVQTGDTVFSMVRPYLRNIAYIDESLSDCIASTGLFVGHPKRFIDCRFAYWLWISEYVVDGLNKSMKGDNSPSIRQEDIEKFYFPIPPKQEQQRIVDRIESLFAKLDEAKEKAQAAVDGFETRKSAILQKAFTSMLTKSWREKHSATTWVKVRLETIAALQTGLMKGKHYDTATVQRPYLRVANVQDGFLDLGEIKMIEVEETKVNRYMLQTNDVLFTEGGDFDKLGRGTVWKGEIKNCLHQNHIFVVRPQKNRLDPYFLSYQAGSRYGKQYFLSCSKQTTNLASINSKQLNSFPVLLPCISEQQEIVRILDDLLAKEQRAKEAAAAVLERIDLIKKSILARAFRGELGTNDPSEESAVELLKQCLAEGEVVP